MFTRNRCSLAEQLWVTVDHRRADGTIGATTGIKARPTTRALPKSTFVLVHSPLVGPSVWRWVGEALEGWGFDVLTPSLVGFADAGPPYWEACVQRVVLACSEMSAPLVLVGHGGAAPLLPAMTLALLGRVKHLTFVEAALPPLSGFAEPAPSWLRSRLAGIAVDAMLPKWSEWWGEDPMEKLIPNPARRSIVENELAQLPLDYFDHVVPVPEHWSERVRCSYLWFGRGHSSDAERATRRGWPVRHLAGRDMTMVVRPKDVAKELSWAAAGLEG